MTTTDQHGRHRARRRALATLLTLVPQSLLGSCSSSGGATAVALDMPAVEFSLHHIVQRRIHAEMWFATAYQAYLNPWRELDLTPPPTEPCIMVQSVTGDLVDGFEWRLLATGCEDLAGVSRTVSGEVTLVGDPFANDKYTGTYSGTMTVQWSADPDGGRTAEADMLNAQAATIAITGSWEVSSASLQGVVVGTVHYAAGTITQADEVR
jgi:hypothetical protein